MVHAKTKIEFLAKLHVDLPPLHVDLHVEMCTGMTNSRLYRYTSTCVKCTYRDRYSSYMYVYRDVLTLWI